MDREQIEKWAREASATGDCAELSGDAIEQFARLVHNAALDLAKEALPERCACAAEPGIVRGQNKPHDAWCPRAIAKAIDVLKEPQP